ncbi:MAG: hypothetical protein ACFFEF_08565 [Candidatus Thorarchaeota archaeon]
MADSDSRDYENYLSPSAKAVLRILRNVEQNQSLDIFQEDPELDSLKIWVKTYRGGLYNKTLRRLRLLVSRGGVKIITQRDLLELIRDLWEQNISRLTKTELTVLEGVLKEPELGLSELAKSIGLNYNKTRRAMEHLRSTTVLRREGRVDAVSLGLDRILIISENPTGVLNSPYFTRFLYVDGSTRYVFLKGLIPSKRRDDFLQTIKTLRSASDNTTVWILSAGLPRFGSAYFNAAKRRFDFDALHFRLLLRAGGKGLTVGSFPVGEVRFPQRFKSSETKIIETLIEDFDMTAQQLAKETGLSESTTFRKRARIVNEGIVRPRPKITIPRLSDRIIGIFSPEAAGNIIHAWAELPLTYTSQITNLENRSEKKIVFATALPAGTARDLLEVLMTEKSRADDFVAYEVSAGASNHLPVSSLYDTTKKEWIFNATFFDVRTYGVCRNEASRKDIPLDLA